MESLFVFAQHPVFLPSSRKCLISVCQPLFPLHKKMGMEKGKEGGRWRDGYGQPSPLLPPCSAGLSPPESYGTSRLGDEARAGDGPRGSDLSGWPMVMV